MKRFHFNLPFDGNFAIIVIPGSEGSIIVQSEIFQLESVESVESPGVLFIDAIFFIGNIVFSLGDSSLESSIIYSIGVSTYMELEIVLGIDITGRRHQILEGGGHSEPKVRVDASLIDASLREIEVELEGLSLELGLDGGFTVRDIVLHVVLNSGVSRHTVGNSSFFFLGSDHVFELE